MRKSGLLVGVLVFAMASLPVGAQPKVDYTGFWKMNCEDPFGLQIKPARGGLYSVSFCKAEYCSEPGAYRPNTRIENDPGYELMSPTRIRVRHPEGGYSTYVKCSKDTTPPTQRR
jgi:hypothetical protein